MVGEVISKLISECFVCYGKRFAFSLGNMLNHRWQNYQAVVVEWEAQGSRYIQQKRIFNNRQNILTFFILLLNSCLSIVTQLQLMEESKSALGTEFWSYSLVNLISKISIVLLYFFFLKHLISCWIKCSNMIIFAGFVYLFYCKAFCIVCSEIKSIINKKDNALMFWSKFALICMLHIKNIFITISFNLTKENNTILI